MVLRYMPYKNLNGIESPSIYIKPFPLETDTSNYYSYIKVIYELPTPVIAGFFYYDENYKTNFETSREFRTSHVFLKGYLKVYLNGIEIDVTENLNNDGFTVPGDVEDGTIYVSYIPSENNPNLLNTFNDVKTSIVPLDVTPDIINNIRQVINNLQSYLGIQLTLWYGGNNEERSLNSIIVSELTVFDINHIKQINGAINNIEKYLNSHVAYKYGYTSTSFSLNNDRYLNVTYIEEIINAIYRIETSILVNAL